MDVGNRADKDRQDGRPGMPDSNHRETTVAGRDILALLCPDWRRATMIVDARDCSIEFANWRCLELLKDETIVCAAGGRLEYRPGLLDQRFQLALQRIRATGTSHETLAATSGAVSLLITVRRLDGLLAEVVRARLGDPDTAHALVVVELATTGDKPSPGAVEGLAATFHLTPAEFRILRGFVNGETLEEIAASSRLALDAVNQAMSDILCKTRCRRQVDLALMVARLCSE